MDKEKENGGGFTFTYSAGEREMLRSEVERIRLQYITEEESGSILKRIKCLDTKAKTPALIIALSLGVAGTSLFGWGMALCLALNHRLAGVITGSLGFVILALAYPFHQFFWQKGKKKYAPEIIQLCDKLLD